MNVTAKYEQGYALLEAIFMAPIGYCPRHARRVLVTSEGNGPGYTGARIYWWAYNCGCSGADLSADNLAAAE
jgi:hypothetical protein